MILRLVGVRVQTKARETMMHIVVTLMEGRVGHEPRLDKWRVSLRGVPEDSRHYGHDTHGDVLSTIVP